jgi:hypothetical protein
LLYIVVALVDALLFRVFLGSRAGRPREQEPAKRHQADTGHPVVHRGFPFLLGWSHGGLPQGVKKNWLELDPWMDWWHIVQA